MARQKVFSANKSQSWFLSWGSPLAIIITVSGQASSPGRSCDRQSRSALQTCSSSHARRRCGQDAAEHTPGTGSEGGWLPNHPVCIGKSISLHTMYHTTHQQWVEFEQPLKNISWLHKMLLFTVMLFKNISWLHKVLLFTVMLFNHNYNTNKICVKECLLTAWIEEVRSP